ncbi:unnamed protein product [Allacma fusca]|uniref:Uncharacterized protein n=1 Tax=Allacma fusca TaxID=39272 RepID=A0A8J2K5B5_9HEXA|nr:unnamed protein product [Allacma fusca]
MAEYQAQKLVTFFLQLLHCMLHITVTNPAVMGGRVTSIYIHPTLRTETNISSLSRQFKIMLTTTALLLLWF